MQYFRLKKRRSRGRVAYQSGVAKSSLGTYEESTQKFQGVAEIPTQTPMTTRTSTYVGTGTVNISAKIHSSFEDTRTAPGWPASDAIPRGNAVTLRWILPIYRRIGTTISIVPEPNLRVWGKRLRVAQKGTEGYLNDN